MNNRTSGKNRTLVRKAILYLLLDGDFLLCHVASALPYHALSFMDGDAVRQMAREEAATMISEGFISLIKCSDPANQEDFSTIAPSQAGQVLLNKTNWDIPDGHTAMTFSIEMTPAGEVHLKKLLAADKDSGSPPPGDN